RYGMTETGILTTNPYEGDRRPGTVGFPLPDVEVRVVPTDDGRSGTTGIVQVRGPGVFAGYWQRPDATDDSFTADGWFVTGDVGAVDVEGRLRLEGRAGDMIISGGENVYPREIELVLDEVDGVAESAVVGVPDDDLGERVVAVVVADGDPPPESNLRRALDGRLARFKHPKRIVWVDALPRNTMGKVQKHLLRAELG
ncbi:MAG: AMP-binding protein, partial [Acidimicrobiia bacterium]|nr:AMP-binding protein [Acidimicrobiia bacterium]